MKSALLFDIGTLTTKPDFPFVVWLKVIGELFDLKCFTISVNVELITSLVEKFVFCCKDESIGVLVLKVVRQEDELGDVRLGDVRLGDVWLGDVRLGDVWLGDVRLGESWGGGWDNCLPVYRSGDITDGDSSMIF